MMPVRHQVLLRLLFACALPLLIAPGHAAAQFELEKVVELSRHGIRPPTPATGKPSTPRPSVRGPSGPPATA
ncbi:hypothetical protein UA70_14120, partial [Raoultella planticola]